MTNREACNNGSSTMLKKLRTALVDMVQNVKVKYILVHKASGEVATHKPLCHIDIKKRILVLEKPQDYVLVPLAEPLHIRRRANTVLIGHVPGAKLANY